MISAAQLGGSDILRLLGENLDPPPERRRAGEARYTDFGAWLQANGQCPRGVIVYSQGSFRIRTTTINPLTGEFDIDTVVRVDYRKNEITQQDLNDHVGGWLEQYAADRQREAHPLAPNDIDRKLRAWTLSYDLFHIDMLPVVPAGAAAPGSDPSWLTDRELRHWQPTNPRGFAWWFENVAAEERQRRLLAKAAERDVQIDDLPGDAVKTVLQLVVQLIKRHRTVFFGDDIRDLAPPSIVITTLAARAYERYARGGRVEDAVRTVVRHMPDAIGRRDGQLWIPNPVDANENFADRFMGNVAKRAALYEWLDAVDADLGTVTAARGIPNVTKAIDERFGGGLGARVARRLGQETHGARSNGTLSSVATGGLSLAGGGRRHRGHDFHGK